MTNAKLIEKAFQVAKRHKASRSVCTGDVGSALVTNKGNLHVGSSIVADCGIGFCAEHSAIASMITHREFVIKKIVAVNYKGRVIPPCGRCRELMYQIDKKNLKTDIVLSKNKTTRLSALLPNLWQEKF